MPGHHASLLVDQDRVGETERADAVGDLPDLPFTMGPRIARVRLEGRYRLIGDRRPAGGAIGRRARRGSRFRCFLHQKPLSRSINILESAAGARHRRGSTEGLDRVDQRWRNRSREAQSHGDNIPALESFNVGPDRSQCRIFWRIWQNPRVISGPFGECSHRSAHCRTDDSGGNVRYGSNVHFAFFNRAVISFTSRFIFSQTLKTPL